MAFNPQEHMTNLKGKDYLEVKWRLVWFRETHPQGSIQTEVVCYAPIVVQSRVYSSDGVLLATGHGSAVTGGKAVWSGREIEKAETAAIGRALGHAGFGTQFDPESDEDGYLADSPISNATSQNSSATSEAPVTPSRTPKEALNGNGHKADGKRTIAPPETSAPVLKNWVQSFQQLMKRPELIEALPQSNHRANAINELYNMGKFEGADFAGAIEIIIHRNDEEMDKAS